MIHALDVKPQYLLAATLVSVSICAFALRANNQQMLELRDAVYVADGRGEGIQESLVALQSYVTAHMNTRLDSGNSGVYPPIQLKSTYERLITERSNKVAASNTQTYSEAQAECERQNPNDFSGRNRIPCIEKFVQSKGVTLPPIPDALYKFSFISPVWSPDLAGWSMVTSIVLGAVTAASLIRQRIHKRKN
jgi:hypothetical protein